MTYHAPVTRFHIRRRPQSARALLLLAAGLATTATAGDPAAIARAVVAERLGIAVADTRVWSVTPRAFADGSLDCPEPGLAYAQVVTPGHVVLVEAEGRRFDVRVAGDGGCICYPRKRPGTRPTPPAPTPSAASGPAARARADLAALLHLPPDAVAVLESHPRGQREGLPGCGAAPAAAGETVITLAADGRTWQYLATGDTVRPCPPAATR
jgi:hypothetical protein